MRMFPIFHCLQSEEKGKARPEKPAEKKKADAKKREAPAPPPPAVHPIPPTNTVWGAKSSVAVSLQQIQKEQTQVFHQLVCVFVHTCDVLSNDLCVFFLNGAAFHAAGVKCCVMVWSRTFAIVKGVSGPGATDWFLVK